MAYSKKITPLLPTALALFLFTFAGAKYAEDQKAARSFQLFGVRLTLKQYSKAQRDLQYAAAISPKNAYYQSSQGLLLARMSAGKFDSTMFLEKRLKFDEDQQKQIAAAALYYQNSLKLNPLDGNCYHNLGWLYSFLERWGDALHCFQRAVAIDGTITLYHVSLGLAYEQAGENEFAYREYGLAICLSPATLDSQFYLDFESRSRAAAERVVSECISRLENQLRSNATPIIKGKLGKLYLHENLVDRAAVILKQAVDELPNLSRTWYNLGSVYEILSDERAMTACYQKAAFLDESDYLSWLKLGEFYEHHDNHRDAIRSYERAVNRWSNKRSENAERVPRIYPGQFVITDDVVPNGFLSYCYPHIEVAEIYRRLANLYGEIGDVNMSNYYNDLKYKTTF
jgi:tetratricopeptide (TPR) repeat protein